MDVRVFTVGPVQENTYLVRRDGAERAVIVDPGDEGERLLRAIDQLGVGLDAVLLTHTHFDHIGAVAPVARATGAPVYCPRLEVPVLNNPEAFYGRSFGRLEPWDPEHTVAGGERLQLAGLEIEVLFTPGHSPGHVTYALEEHGALFDGDVLFQGSIGRTDLPGGDYATLMGSIAGLLDRFGDETTVYPGHMGVTTLGRERATNPFLQELAGRRGAGERA